MKHLYYLTAKVEVEVKLSILGESISQALGRAKDGAWHGVVPNWDKSKFIEPLDELKEGPKVN